AAAQLVVLRYLVVSSHEHLVVVEVRQARDRDRVRAGGRHGKEVVCDELRYRTEIGRRDLIGRVDSAAERIAERAPERARVAPPLGLGRADHARRERDAPLARPLVREEEERAVSPVVERAEPDRTAGRAAELVALQAVVAFDAARVDRREERRSIERMVAQE